MSLTAMARQVLSNRKDPNADGDKTYIENGWEVLHESVLICPHGHRIEWDGNCPDGCSSPLKNLAMI